MTDSPAAGNAASAGTHHVIDGTWVPEEWVKAAESHYSMHGAGLIRNIITGVAPLIAAAENERCASLAESAGATYLQLCDDDDQQRVLHTHHRRPFADLLREDGHV
jgi:hypothetical protein